MILTPVGGDEATRLFICSWFSLAASIAARQERNPRLQRDSWGCSPQRGTDSFKNAAECRYESEPNRVPSGNWKKKKMTV